MKSERSCSNKMCRRHASGYYPGVRFTLYASCMRWFCEDCGPNTSSSYCGNLYDFETTHLTGERIHVTSKRHLQQLEKEHGVSSCILNYNQRNWDRR